MNNKEFQLLEDNFRIREEHLEVLCSVPLSMLNEELEEMLESVKGE